MKRSWLLTLAAPVVLAGSLQAATVDYFLKIPGLEGESTDARHTDSIEVLKFSWGATNDTSGDTSGGTTGGSAGKSHLQDITCTMRASKATPKLMLACATGQPIPSATLYVRKDESAEEDYLVIAMTDILVSSVKQEGLGRTVADTSQSSSTSGDADDRPTEEVAFYYNRATFTYVGEDGTRTSVELSRTAAQ